MLSSFAPFIIIKATQSHIQLGAILAFSWALGIQCLFGLLHVTGIAKLKKFPKYFDVCNILLYFIIFILGFTEPEFLATWASVITDSCTFLIMLSSLMFVPFTTSIAMESTPQEIWDTADFKKLNMRLSVLWTAALGVSSAAAIALAVLETVGITNKVAVILCRFVFGLGSILLAAFAQMVIAHRFKKAVIGTRNVQKI